MGMCPLERSCSCPVAGNIQDQVGWSLEQPSLVKVVPAQGREGGTGCSLRSLPTQTVLWFYGSVILNIVGWKS